MEILKKDVQEKFDKIREAINLREKLLLRQIDAISSISNRKNNKNCVTTGTTNNNYNSSTTFGGSGKVEDIKFVTENEETIFSYLRTFGKFSLDNINFANDLYANEDYILPNVDHEIMYKQMPIKDSCSNNSLNGEKIIVDFSNNKKLFNDNVNNINESIINITLNEAKELIKRTEQVPLINYNVQNIFQTASIVSIESSSSSSPVNDEKCNSAEQLELTTKTSLESNQTDNGKTKNNISSHKKSFKPKITINNCNGTINLKNISNLIINCANQDTMNMEKNNNSKSPTDSIAESQPIFSSITENGNGNNADEEEDEEFDDDYEEPTTNNSTRTTTTTTTKDNEENCEFYNRLISEIKNTLKQQPQHKHTNNKATTTDNIPLESSSDSSCKSRNNNNNNDHNTNSNRKFLIRNFENLKIVLETNHNDDNQTPTQHPVQIEQWLAEIISETEVEPVQHTEILETKNTRNNSILLENE